MGLTYLCHAMGMRLLNFLSPNAESSTQTSRTKHSISWKFYQYKLHQNERTHYHLLIHEKTFQKITVGVYELRLHCCDKKKKHHNGCCCSLCPLTLKLSVRRQTQVKWNCIVYLCTLYLCLSLSYHFQSSLKLCCQRHAAKDCRSNWNPGPRQQGQSLCTRVALSSNWVTGVQS